MFLQRGLVATLVLPRSRNLIARALVVPPIQSFSAIRWPSFYQPMLRRMTTDDGDDGIIVDEQEPAIPIRHIGKAEMQQILDAPDDTSLVVIDVRTPDEVTETGKLAPHVHTLPVQIIHATTAFALDDEAFEVLVGFPKPKLDQTLVFTCAAGIRSVYACTAAQAAGYTKVVNYAGGAHEWFDYSW